MLLFDYISLALKRASIWSGNGHKLFYLHYLSAFYVEAKEGKAQEQIKMCLQSFFCSAPSFDDISRMIDSHNCAVIVRGLFCNFRYVLRVP